MRTRVGGRILSGGNEGRQRLRRRPSERGHHSTRQAVVDRVHVAGEVQATDRVRILVVVLREKKLVSGVVLPFWLSHEYTIAQPSPAPSAKHESNKTKPTQAMTLKVCGSSMSVAATSTTHDSSRPRKSCETSSSSETEMTFVRGAMLHLRLPAAASRRGCSRASLLSAGRSSRTVKSTIETLLVGTRTLRPANLPANSGRTSATALLAPVLVGMMFCPTPRPAVTSTMCEFLQSRASTASWWTASSTYRAAPTSYCSRPGSAARVPWISKGPK